MLLQIQANSKKDNYSNITIDRLKSLSTNENNTESLMVFILKVLYQ